MSLERERKFIVKNFPTNYFDRTHIIQAYLVLNPDHHVRLRIIDNKVAFLCYKQFINETDREEIEYRVDFNDAAEQFNNGKWLCFLSKYRFKYEGWDIDTYPNGLTVAEFEFSDENPFPETLPDWIGEEITGKEEYSNIHIALNFQKFQ